MGSVRIFQPLEVQTIAATLLAGLLIYWVFSALSSAVFHPLAKFPGPKLSAASDWWLVYHEWFLGKSLTDILFDLHRIYGMVIQFQLIILLLSPRPFQ